MNLNWKNLKKANQDFRCFSEIRKDQNEISAEAHDIIVLYNFQKKIKMMNPADIRTKLLEMSHDQNCKI